jgi:hypothetical protein
VVYLLRTAPLLGRADLLGALASVFRVACERVLNVTLTDRLWSKVSLSLRMGGLGIRDPRDLAAPCFVSSVHSSATLVEQLLPERYHETFRAWAAHLRNEFLARVPGVDAAALDWASQGALDGELETLRERELAATAAGDGERARLLAARERFGYRWLEALPCAKVGTLLEASQFRVCAGLRVGAAVCHAHPCSRCGGWEDGEGTHGLVCARSVGRQPRHRLVNQVIADGLRSAGFPVRLEPANLLLADGKRPDGVTLIPYSRGQSVMWDATVWTTVCASQLRDTARRQGAAAEAAEAQKRRKYAPFARDYLVTPLAFESHGPLSVSTAEFLGDLSKKISRERGKSAGTFFLQRLCLAVQRGNALSILGTMECEASESLLADWDWWHPGGA